MTNSEVITLREYIEARIAAQKEFFAAKIEAIETATRIALVSNERRLEGMNEFRDALKDQTKQYVTIPEHERTRDDVKNLQVAAAKVEGKAEQSTVNIALLMGGGALLLSLLTFILKLLGK